MAWNLVQQAVGSTTSSAASIDLVFSTAAGRAPITAGNLIALQAGRQGSADRTLTITDQTNGDPITVPAGLAENVGTQCEVEMGYIEEATGGDTTYRLAPSSITTIRFNVSEWSGQLTGADPLSAAAGATTAGATTHYAASSTEIDTHDDVLIIAGYAFSGTVSSVTWTGYTAFASVAAQGYFGYRIVSGAGLTDERATLSHGGPTRNSAGGIMAFKPAASGSSVSVTDSGSGADDTQGIAAALAATDTGAGSDVLAALSAALSMADTGSGVDAIAAISVSLALEDTALGTDALTALAAALELADTASGADAINVVSEILKTVTDSVSGTDEVAITVIAQLTETASGADAIGAITVLAALADSGAGVDVVVRLDDAARLVKATFTLRARAMTFLLTERRAAMSFAARSMQCQLAA